MTAAYEAFVIVLPERSVFAPEQLYFFAFFFFDFLKPTLPALGS